jgi:hypothetical protein
VRTTGRRTTIPDALFGIDWPDGAQQNYALEVEYHTRAPQSFLRKVARYAAAAHRSFGIHGDSNPIVLVVGRDPKRLESYRAATVNFAPPIAIAFATLADVERLGPMAAIWKTSVDSEQLWLRSLPSCGYRNHTPTPETLGESRARTASAAHKSDVPHA